MSDNERRYQGLLRKQRLELNYLLKERERLLQAQRKLSDLAGQPLLEENGEEFGDQKNAHTNTTQKPFPSLTKAELRKQEKQKKRNKSQRPMRQLFSKMDNEEQFYGSEREFYPPVTEAVEQSDFKAPLSG